MKRGEKQTPHPILGYPMYTPEDKRQPNPILLETHNPSMSKYQNGNIKRGAK